MRYLIALMAVLALLLNPVAAAAAQVACETSMGAMAAMESPGQSMAAMPGMAKADAAHQAGADPCCGHSSDGKMDGKTCAQACASTCAVMVALPVAAEGQPLAYTRATIFAARLAWPSPHDPSGLERPPKSIL